MKNYFLTRQLFFKEFSFSAIRVSQSLKIIYNPASRNGRSKKIADKVRAYLDEIGSDYHFVETEAPTDGISKAQQAKEEGYSTVCSIGGDGTAHEVANGAIRENLIFGIIPAGSGNDFANGVGIDGNWEQALDILQNGKVEKISVVQIGDRYSINVADAGLGADVSRRSSHQLKWMTGSFKYTLLTLRGLIGHKPYPCTIRLDNDQEFEVDANMVVAGFGQRFGSGMNILPDARFNNDQMDVAIIHSASRFTLLRLFPKVFSGKHVNHKKYVTMLRGKELEVIPKTVDRTLYTEAEGEIIGQGQVTMKAIPKEFKVILPKEWDLGNKTL